jgi:ribonuclease T2
MGKTAAKARGLMLAAMVAAVAVGMGTAAQARRHGSGDGGGTPSGTFDYYVLSLSWAQGYCDVTAHPDRTECGEVKGFVLHGLWPQRNNGTWPADCNGPALPDAERQRSQGLYASPSLITHEWPKHGTCSGLAPAAYFDLARADVGKVRIPAGYQAAHRIAASDAAAVRQAFIAANPGLTAAGIRTVVVHGEVTQVDVCLTNAGARAGTFRGC